MALWIIFSLGCFFLGWLILEPSFFRITRFESPCSKLNRPLQILHLSDIHFSGPHANLARFFDRLSQLEPDLIVITGDVIDCREGVAYAAQELAKLHAKLGIFAVMGNHDYYNYRLYDCLFRNFQGEKHPLQRNGTLRLRAVYKKLKIKELRNYSIHLDADGQRIGIHGVDDPVTGHADLTRIRPEKGRGVVNLLLSHTLDVVCGLSDHEIDVCFSGHTHGGQVCIPGWGAIVTHSRIGRRYASGLHRFMNILCCVSRGISSSRFMRIRFFSRPEAILLTLHPQESKGLSHNK